jgi:diguanylate cyclase (GGDEF)-like protein/PAS domain S-box-containing protein
LTTVAALGDAASALFGDFEAFARKVTEHAARACGCERANVWLFNDEQTELRCIDAYQATSACHSHGAVLLEEQFVAEFDIIKHALYVDASDALTDPRTAGYRDGYLVPLGIVSMLDVAIRTGAGCVGLLCLEHVGARHDWAPDEIAFACHLADKLGQAIMNQALQQSERRLSLATQAARIGIYDWDILQDRLLLDACMSEQFGAADRQCGKTFQDMLACIHPDDRDRCARVIADALNSATSFALEFRVALPDGAVRYLEGQGLVQRDADGRANRVIGVNWDCTERRLSQETIRRQADQYATMLATTSDGFWLLDRDGRFQSANDSYCRMTGYTREELLGLWIGDLEAMESSAETSSHMANIAAVGFDRFETRHRRKDGTVIDIEASVSLWKETGQYICFAREITAHKEAQRALEESEASYRHLFQSSRDGMLILDLTSRTVMSANPSVVAMFGLATEHEFLARKPWDFSPERQPDGRLSMDKAHEVIGTALQKGSHFFEWVHLRQDNTRFPCDVLLTPVTVGERQLLYSTIRDISDRKAAEAQIMRMAHFDSLTGLANRAAFAQALNNMTSRVRRSGSYLAVLYLDLDRFKDVNDSFGHPAGDLLLRTAAERLQASVRKSDLVARFGGDEFAILLGEIASAPDKGGTAKSTAARAAANAAEKIISRLREPFVINGNIVHSSASVGVAVYGAETPEAESILAHADVALYKAKAEQRGAYRFYSEGMDAEVRARVRMSNELREAIARQQFFLLYQPQIDVQTGRIAGLEALIRWHHPREGIVSPARFIPDAEREGLIVPLGRWVLQEACRQTRQWLDAGISPPLIAVNLSGNQFKAPTELENDIEAAVAEAQLPPELLELELTESVLMEASRDHNRVLLRLRERGHRIAIDDFGTGYSSLDYLRRFPVDRIKIAQKFIAEIGINHGNDAIVRAALGLAHELGLEVVVEGVETNAQLAILKDWGARTVQGYLFSKALAAPATTAFLKEDAILKVPGFQQS